MRRLMYLRKSRSDNPDESVGEVLAKHETILQEFAVREYGAPIPEEDIYREVVSGESIEERVEIQKVLREIEHPDVAAVIVVEPQRLSRGDLEDCGRLISILQYSNTLVITPTMTYDLSNKMERRFFQDELLRGRDYLEYIKEILTRGRIAAVKRGCFVAPIAPFGYDRVKIGKDWTLSMNGDADLVRTIFSMYVDDGMTPRGIAVRLNRDGVPSPNGRVWGRDAIYTILRNVHYTGKVRWNKIRETSVIEDGERVKKHLRQPAEDIIIAEGKHPAIIPQDVFDAAQERIAAVYAPRAKSNTVLVNPLAGVLRCACCGNVMSYMQVHRQQPRYNCRLRPSCCRSILYSEMIAAVLNALKSGELPALKMKAESGSAVSAKAQAAALDKLTRQMEDLRAQEERQYDLLETGKYTQELFDRRNASLREKMDALSEKIKEVRNSIPTNIDYAERLASLEAAIAALESDTVPVAEKNRLVRSVISSIYYSAPPPGTKQNDFSLSINLSL